MLAIDSAGEGGSKREQNGAIDRPGEIIHDLRGQASLAETMDMLEDIVI